MPQAIPLILAAVGIGTSVAGTVKAFSGGGGAPQPSPAEVTKQAVDQETMKRSTATKEASQFLPQLQADTSGGLSPDALREFSANFSGNADVANSQAMQQMVAKFLGLDTGASFGGSSPFGSSSSPLSTGLAG